MDRIKRATGQAWAILVCLVVALAVPGTPAMAEPSELFFSEYVEGSSYNKALEIYNGTGADVDLAAGEYSIKIYFNGSTTAGTTIDLTGTVAAGDVYVVADDSADPAILSAADQTSSANFFNGDDAVALLKAGVTVDVIGQIGVDPGSLWGSGDCTTQNDTLRRKDTVEAGDPDGSDAFDPALEWDGYPQDTFDGLGTHGMAVELTPIYDIQYTADPGGDSPLDGQVVTTEGVVTARFWGGYFIQDPAGGPWSGVYVYDSSTPALGDRLRITGAVDEYYNLTEIKSLSEYVLLSSGNPLPAAEVLPTGEVSQEQWEGVLVRVEGVEVTDPDMGHGEWAVSDGSGDVVIDDRGSYTYVPTLGDPLDAVTGPLDYSFGAFKIQPRNDCDIVVPGPGYTTIYAIQCAVDPRGDSSYDGQVVTTEGVVTAQFEDGYFIQDPAGGPWSGVYVYNPSTPTLGDRLRITGAVDEYYNLTEIKSLSEYVLLSLGNPLPAAEVLPTGEVSQEQWEGVLVRVEGVEVTDPNMGYGEWAVSDGSGEVVIDDRGSYTYVPTLGDLLDAVTGPLDYSFGAFKIQPRDDADIGSGVTIIPMTIPEIQGEDTASPHVGAVVRTSGVVVGTFEGNMPGGGIYNGFYLQDPAGDANAGTSDGVYVNLGTLSVEVTVGQMVTVIGAVREFNEYGDPPPETETQIAVGKAANVIPAGAGVLPAAVTIDPPGEPIAAEAYLESLEGMLVDLPGSAVVVGPTNYGTIHIVPGSAGVTRVLRGSEHEGMTFGVRPDERYGSGAPNLIVGSTIEGVDGPMAYTYGDYVVADQDGYATTYAAPTPPVPSWPSAMADELTVASFNTYNFDWAGRERIKVANTIEALGGPLLVGLQEIDVDGVIDALLADLAEAGYTYDYAYSHPDVGGHGVAMLWRTDRVSDVTWSTSYQACSAYGSDSSVAYDDYCAGTGLYPLFSRRPVVITASVSIDGHAAPVIAIANHFKSKSGGDPADDQRRLEQAQFVAGLVDGFLAGDPDANVIVLGDLNDFEDSPPLLALTGSGALSNLWYTLPAEARYSYIYEGVSQVLDHILVSPSLLARLVAMAPLHTNADYPYNPFAGDESVIWRTSDHDPVAATFVFHPPAAAFTPSETVIYVDESVTFVNESTGDALHYEWNFGDGLTSAETSPTHTWAAPGLYTVVLTASNDLGSDTASTSILVRPRIAPFARFAVHQATVVWSGRGADQGRVELTGWLSLPEGYTPADLRQELEIALDVGGTTLSAAVPLTENGAVWHLKQEPGTKSAIVKASLIWPENDEGAVAFQVIAELAGADAATAPAQLTLRLALPVLGDQLAERVAGEETLDMRAHGRSWTYVAP